MRTFEQRVDVFRPTRTPTPIAGGPWLELGVAWRLAVADLVILITHSRDPERGTGLRHRPSLKAAETADAHACAPARAGQVR